MRIRSLVFLVGLAMTSVAVAAPSPSAPQASRTAPDPDDPLSGPWSSEALEEAAAPLFKLRRLNGAAAGDGALETRLSATPDAAERARLLTAYGVTLMSEDSDDPIAAAALALPYMKRAVAEGRQGFAADSRMLAMLLSDAARTEFMARGSQTSADAERWLEEAHRIRVARLGPGHIETLSTLTGLADIRSVADGLNEDPARVQAVAALYEPLLGADPVEGTDRQDLTMLFNQWTVFLAGARRPDEACAVLDKMNALSDRLGLDMAYAGYVLGEALSEAGYADRAAPLIDLEASAMALLGARAPTPGKPPRCGR
jgi:hypothetical protein